MPVRRLSEAVQLVARAVLQADFMSTLNATAAIQWRSCSTSRGRSGCPVFRSVRMGLFVSFSQSASAHMGIDLSRRQTFVA